MTGSPKPLASGNGEKMPVGRTEGFGLALGDGAPKGEPATDAELEVEGEQVAVADVVAESEAETALAG